MIVLLPAPADLQRRGRQRHPVGNPDVPPVGGSLACHRQGGERRQGGAQGGEAPALFSPFSLSMIALSPNPSRSQGFAPRCQLPVIAYYAIILT